MKLMGSQSLESIYYFLTEQIDLKNPFKQVHGASVGRRGKALSFFTKRNLFYNHHYHEYKIQYHTVDKMRFQK